jgi:toxin ParE1/3/4
MSDFRLDPQASRDLSNIFRYIAADNFPAAERWRDKLIDLFIELGRNPYLGERRSLLAMDLRSISVGNYVVYFRPRTGYVQIARIIHGARDINSIFPRERTE